MHCTLRVLLLGLVLLARPARGESKTPEYPGVTDPFTDPAQYEFAEDEKEDKEFFHLGRFLMVGLDLGAGIFTGGLGQTTSPGFMVGGRFAYFFDKAFAFEGRVHYSNHIDQIRGTGNIGADINTDLTQIGAGFRYYFDTKSAPRAIAIANPYVAFGAGLYLRNQSIIQQVNFSGLTSPNSTSFGGAAGGGIEFLIYRKHIYLGLDIRYHMIFWPDANSTFNNLLPVGARAGGFVNTLVTASYNF